MSSKLGTRQIVSILFSFAIFVVSINLYNSSNSNNSNNNNNNNNNGYGIIHGQRRTLFGLDDHHHEPDDSIIKSSSIAIVDDDPDDPAALFHDVSLMNPKKNLLHLPPKAGKLLGKSSSVVADDHDTTNCKSSSSGITTDEESVPLEQQIPRLIVAGAQKGGTTALYNILRKDQQFLWHAPRCRSSPELHFFDTYIRKPNFTLDGVTFEEWQEFLNDEDNPSTKVIQAMRREYAHCWNFELHKRNPLDSISFEKTPIYMIYPGLPALIKKIAPWAKVLFMIRDPVKRAYSSWKMHNSREEAPEEFEFYLNQEINTLRQQGLSNAPKLENFSLSFTTSSSGSSSFQLPHDMAERRIKRGSNMRDKSQVYLYRGMYAELLHAWMEHFDLGRNMMVVSYERFLQDRLGMVNQIQRFIGANVTNVSSDVLEKDYHGGYTAARLNETTRQYLEHFFQPYNQELAELLGQEWYDYHVGNQWSSTM